MEDTAVVTRRVRDVLSTTRGLTALMARRRPRVGVKVEKAEGLKHKALIIDY